MVSNSTVETGVGGVVGVGGVGGVDVGVGWLVGIVVVVDGVFGGEIKSHRWDKL